MSGCMRRIVDFLVAGGMYSCSCTTAQELALKRGVVMDSLPVNDSIARRIILYLPQDFDTGQAVAGALSV